MDNKNLNFDKAIPVLLEIEGGYSNNPYDLGGETNFGISKKQYPHLDIKNLTPKMAKDIYYNDFWLKFRLHEIVDFEISKQLLLMFVNLSYTSAAYVVQKAINRSGGNVKQDGVIGSGALLAINQLDKLRLSDCIRLELVKFYLGRVMLNKTQKVNLEGWIRRAML